MDASDGMPSGRPAPDDLLTTAAAAAVLGTSRRHVVDLCNRGLLACSWTGSQRWIRRCDLDLVRTDTSTMTRPERRSLWLATAVAGRIAEDPGSALAVARAEVDRTETLVRGQALDDVTEWRRLLDGPVHELLVALTDPTPRGRQRRKSAPFAGVLDPARRDAALTAWRAEEQRLAGR